MNVLTDSLDASSFEPPEPHFSLGDVPPSAEAARAAHDDAVQLARDGMHRALVGLVAAAGLVALATTFSYSVVFVVPAVALSIWATSATYTWWRLSRVDPLEQWHREHTQDVEEARSIREMQQRVLATSGIATYTLTAVVIAVTAVQFLVPGIARSVTLAALVKPAVRAGEWWRLLTAAYLHGSFLHVYANVGALLVIGRLVEAYSRPSRIALAFLVGAIGGSLASTMLLSAPSLGASGGVLGLVGFLMAVTSASGPTTTWLRTYLVRTLIGTAALGAIAFFMIDNAGHAGGVASGYLLGLIVARLDARAFGGWSRAVDASGHAALAVLLAGATFTIGRLIQAW